MPRIFHKSLVVAPESIDAVGHVNNREYLRWMEDIAVEHSAAQGWPMERYFEGGNAWVAATHFLEYLRPAFAGDTLDVYTWIAHVGPPHLRPALCRDAPAQDPRARRNLLDLRRTRDRSRLRPARERDRGLHRRPGRRR